MPMFRPLAAAAALAALAGCAGPASMAFDAEAAPAAIKVPAGHRIAMETVATGKITYECRQKFEQPSQFEWVPQAPDATLNDRNDRLVGKHYGPLATWAGLDGSSVSGNPVATAPGEPGSLPLQLVKATSSSGNGMFTNVSYIQRVATRHGTVPADTCNAQSHGTKADATYRADYIFWKPI